MPNRIPPSSGQQQTVGAPPQPKPSRVQDSLDPKKPSHAKLLANTDFLEKANALLDKLNSPTKDGKPPKLNHKELKLLKQLEKEGLLPKPPAKPEGAAQGAAGTKPSSDSSTATVPKASVL